MSPAETVLRLPQFEQHPLGTAFPPIPDSDFEELKASVSEHGQVVEGIVHEGMILDGWHRYCACYELGIPFLYRDLRDDEDAVATVKALNIPRRHLTGDQRAAALVKVDQIAADRAAAAGTDYARKTRQEIAEEAGVSVRTVARVRAAERAGKLEDVVSGEVSAEQASGELAKRRKGGRKDQAADDTQFQRATVARSDDDSDDSEAISPPHEPETVKDSDSADGADGADANPPTDSDDEDDGDLEAAAEIEKPRKLTPTEIHQLQVEHGRLLRENEQLKQENRRLKDENRALGASNDPALFEKLQGELASEREFYEVVKKQRDAYQDRIGTMARQIKALRRRLGEK